MALNPCVILPTYYRYQRPAGDPAPSVPTATIPSWAALLGIVAAGGLGWMAGGASKYADCKGRG